MNHSEDTYVSRTYLLRSCSFWYALVIQFDRLDLQTPRFVSARVRRIIDVLLSSAARIPEIVDGIYSIACTFIRIKRRLIFMISESARRLMKPDENQTCLFPRPSGFHLDLTDKITLFTRAHASSLLDWGSRVRVAIAALPATPGRRRDASRRYIRTIIREREMTWLGRTVVTLHRSCNVVIVEISRHQRYSDAIRVSLLNRTKKASARSLARLRIAMYCS